MTTLDEPPNSPSPGIYQHYKGDLYQVLGMARHSETEEWMVVYRALYGEQGFWLRPLSLWLEPAKPIDQAAGVVPTHSTTRFRLIEPKPHTLSSIMKTG